VTQTAFTTTDEMTPLECFDWLVAVYIDRGFPARPDSPAGLRVAKVRSALTHEKPLPSLQDKDNA
jgi:hypothetical protein